jgi:hypothetical protein
MYLRLYRSAQTPPARASKTEERTREARIRPKVVAVPPASRTVTASAIGKAEDPMTTRSPDNLLSQEVRCRVRKVLLLRFARRKDLIDEAVIGCLLGSEDLVALDVLADIFNRSRRVTR